MSSIEHNREGFNMSDFSPSARVVIVGGGVMGVGLAYHLAHEGWGEDTILLEKAELTSGSTWHAAGQITQSTSSYALGKMVDYNIQLYSKQLEEETGQAVTWHGCGSFRLAYSDDEMDWLTHTLSVGRALGFNMECVPPDYIAKHHPFYNLEGIKGGLHTPDDGHVDPTNVTMALAKGARLKGVKIIRHCRATNITQRANGEWCVETEKGAIICEHVVNAGGTYARQMGEWSGLQLPMTSMTHHYFVTEPVPEFQNLERELPVIRDDKSVSGYIRMEQKKGLIGIYEKENPKTVWEDYCPWEVENELFAPDYDRIMPWLENALERMPIFAELGISRTVHGAISHPPDGNPLIGPAPHARNYWCCCGTQIGIGWGPGLTRELARWIVHGSADISMREFDPRRFGNYAHKDWQVIKAKEDYCLRHEIPFPHFNRLAGRPIKPSPLYERLKARGAVHEEVFGHERPRFFVKDGSEAKDYYSFKRSPLHEIIEREVTAVRRGAGIMDISAFTKIEISGDDAARFLEPLIANRLPKKIGGIVLAHILNERGRIEMEVTLARFDENRYYIVCAAFFENRLLDHLSRYKKEHKVEITLRSNDWAALSLNGPKSRDILQSVTNASLSNQDFPWMKAHSLNIDGNQCYALRMSYAGELGWELHGERAAIQSIYDIIEKAGTAHGLVDYGSFAMNVMRLEKGFKGAGELTNEVTLLEADVMRFVKLDKYFIGKDATLTSLKASETGAMPWICVYLAIESNGIWDGHGGEAVRINGEIVGAISSIAYSPTVDKILAFAYVSQKAAQNWKQCAVYLAGSWRHAEILTQPAYDADNHLPRAEE